MASTALVRSFFLGGAVVGIGLNSVPVLSTSTISYGARAQSSEKSTEKVKTIDKTTPSTPPSQIPQSVLGWIKSGVPHYWFIHYYILSVVLSIFWGFQLLTKGRAFLFIAQYVDTSPSAPSMRPHQTMLCWLLLTFQGSRRLFESVTLTKPSASRMPWTIWLIGISYYLFMSVAVWIEGTKAIMNSSFLDLTMPVLPSIRTTLGLIVFTFAYGIQHDCHAYLADLKKYTLPTHPAFHRIVSPHYTAELVLYIALAIIAAPVGYWVNWTLMCNVIWVLVNLGIVADETKKWSEGKFGKESVKDRARMIPGIW